MSTERPQPAKPDEKKKAEDKGFFVQLPCYLIDKYQDTLTSTAFVAFLRFIRKYSKKGDAEYKGSYRALSKVLNISHTSAIRVTDQWQNVGIATKQENEESDLLTITVSLTPIWQKNIEYSKGLDSCPNLGKVEQNVTTQPLTNGSVVTENAMSVTNIDTAVTFCDNLVTFCSTFEHKNDPRYRYILDILESFLGTPEKASCSQEITQPTEEKKWLSPIDFTAELAASRMRMDGLDDAFALESLRLQEKHHHQSTPSQVIVPIAENPATAELFPTPPKPNQYNIPNLRAGLNERDASQVTPAQQKRIDAAERRNTTLQEQKRERGIWQHYASLLNTPVDQIIQDDFSKRAVKALLKAKVTDEHITATFTYLKGKKLATTLSFIATNLNSVVASAKPQEKPKSDLIDFTHWTDDEYDNWRRTGVQPAHARRA